MTTLNKLILLGTLFSAVLLMAQTGTPGLGITSATSGATCGVVTGATVTECAATDGLWIAIGTGPFAKVATGATSAGVTSFNGRTGAVVSSTGDYGYSQLSGTAPVVSVNGKSGAVVLGASTSATTTIQ